MSFFDIVHIEEMCRRGSIKDADVVVLRKTVASHNVLDQSSIDDLFRIQALCHLQCPAWAEFFVETVTDFLVREKQPTGYLTLEHVRYLIERIERNDRLETKTEFDLVLNLLDKARWAPERLVTAALEEVHVAIATGFGVLRGGQDRASGEVTTQDIADIRRILYAFGGDEGSPLTRTEAEILFAIDECLSEPDRPGEWAALFTLSVANVMLSVSGYRVPPRDVALGYPAVSQSGDTPGQQLRTGIDRILGASSRMSPEERSIARLERQRIEIVTGEQAAEPDAIWLVERLEQRFATSPHLGVLLARFRDRDTPLHPALRSVVLRHARAA